MLNFSIPLSKTTIGIACASAGVCFLGYCIYFDKKRRSDPLFKEKLKQRRKNKAENKTKSNTAFPDLKDPEAIQKFFMQEIQTGEHLLAEGSIEEGIEHITNAVVVCGQPQHLLSILQQTLPQAIFQMLVQRLPKVSQQMSSAYLASTKTSSVDKIPETELELE